jgi:hypothetical protein
MGAKGILNRDSYSARFARDLSVFFSAEGTKLKVRRNFLSAVAAEES